MPGTTKWVYLLPILPWILSLLIFNVGAVIFPPLSTWTVGLLTANFIIFIIGVRSGRSLSKQQFSMGKRFALFEFCALIGVIITSLAGILWVFDLHLGGFRAVNTMQDTAMVRHIHLGTTSTLTTIASPICSLSGCLLIYAVYYYANSSQPLKFFFLPLLVLSNGFLIYVTVLIASRNGIFQIALLAVNALILVGIHKWSTIWKAINPLAKLLLGSLVIGSLLYTVFITAERQDNFQYEASLGRLNLRYPLMSAASKSSEATAILGSYYFGHSLANLDNLGRGESLPFFNWDWHFLGEYIRQIIGKIAEEDLFDKQVREQVSFTAGINPVEWPSGFADLILDFGIIGSLLYIFIFGNLHGLISRGYQISGSFEDFLFLVVSTSFCGQLVWYYPGSQFVWITIIACVAIKLLCRCSGMTLLLAHDLGKPKAGP